MMRYAHDPKKLAANVARHQVWFHEAEGFEGETAVILIDDDTKEMRIKIARQISYTFTKSFKKNEPPPMVERVVHENAPLLFNNIAKDSDEYRQIKLEHDFQSAILVPIIRNQRAG